MDPRASSIASWLNTTYTIPVTPSWVSTILSTVPHPTPSPDDLRAFVFAAFLTLSLSHSLPHTSLPSPLPLHGAAGVVRGPVWAEVVEASEIGVSLGRQVDSVDGALESYKPLDRRVIADVPDDDDEDDTPQHSLPKHMLKLILSDAAGTRIAAIECVSLGDAITVVDAKGAKLLLENTPVVHGVIQLRPFKAFGGREWDVDLDGPLPAGERSGGGSGARVFGLPVQGDRVGVGRLRALRDELERKRKELPKSERDPMAGVQEIPYTPPTAFHGDGATAARREQEEGAEAAVEEVEGLVVEAEAEDLEDEAVEVVDGTH
ncbi:hypothetical protein PYCC9005_003892 [Savitreella phatthalungensis]